MRRDFFICLLLAGVTLAVFWPVGRLGFIKYDDYGHRGYVVDNTNVQAGITAASVRWAFTTRQASNWHPITWLSHMLDCQWFGLNAGGHHWTSLGFHVANALLLFLVLRRMMGLRRNDSQQPYDSPSRNANQTTNAAVAAATPQVGLRSERNTGAVSSPESLHPAETAATPQTGGVWRCAVVAALFAWHPLRVESVAWVSERKDVLSGFFFMLTLWAYTRYAQGRSKAEGRGSRAGSGSLALDPLARRSEAKIDRGSTLDYCLTLVFFALGLMSKPMLVTLPLLLLLLDFWPLRRERNEGGSTLNHLLLEKLPFFVLSLASSVATIWAHGEGAIVTFDRLPWDLRIEHSVVSYTAYLGKMFWPANLCIFYPYTKLHPWEAVISGLLLILVSIYFIRRVRFQPYLLAGWLWFLVMLVPVIGLVQTGGQSMANRYTYLPSIGLSVLVVWGMADLAAISRFWQIATATGVVAALLACLLATRHQLSYWRDSVVPFRHALEVAGESPMGNFLLGNALQEVGDLDGAAKNFRTAVQIAPDYEDAHFHLGFALLQKKEFEEAEVQFGEVLRLNPTNVYTHICLGYVLGAQGKFADADAEFSTAMKLKPDNEVIREALTVFAKKAETYKILSPLYETLKIQPTAETHARIAAVQAEQGEFQEAVVHFLAALRLQPNSPDVLNNLAWLLATCPDAHIRDGVQAVKCAQKACVLTHYGVTLIVGTLAAAHAEAGQFDEAVAAAEKACALAEISGETNLLQRNRELLELYRAHQPYHETR